LLQLVMSPQLTRRSLWAQQIGSRANDLQHPFSADVAETALDLSERFSGGPENAAALEELPVALGGPLYCTGRGKRAPGASLV
jgi:hypothetical protein